MNQLRMPSPAILVAVLALVAALAGTAIASQRVSIDSKVTLAATGADCSPQGGCTATAFSGRVTSSKHACEVHRTVKVFDLRGPRPNKLIEKDRSSDHGKWRFVSSPPGRFFAKVLRREEGTPGHSFGCDSDRSKTLDYH